MLSDAPAVGQSEGAATQSHGIFHGMQCSGLHYAMRFPTGCPAGNGISKTEYPHRFHGIPHGANVNPMGMLTRVTIEGCTNHCFFFLGSSISELKTSPQKTDLG